MDSDPSENVTVREKNDARHTSFALGGFFLPISGCVLFVVAIIVGFLAESDDLINTGFIVSTIILLAILALLIRNARKAGAVRVLLAGLAGGLAMTGLFYGACYFAR